VEKGEQVPGSAVPNDNAYRLSQILAFVAGTRRDVDAIHERLAGIARLMGRVGGGTELAAGVAG
jgi:hypothetical protein